MSVGERIFLWVTILLAVLIAIATVAAAYYHNGRLYGEKEVWRKTAIMNCWETRGKMVERRYKHGAAAWEEK